MFIPRQYDPQTDRIHPTPFLRFIKSHLGVEKELTPGTEMVTLRHEYTKNWILALKKEGWLCEIQNLGPSLEAIGRDVVRKIERTLREVVTPKQVRQRNRERSSAMARYLEGENRRWIDAIRFLARGLNSHVARDHYLYHHGLTE